MSSRKIRLDVALVLISLMFLLSSCITISKAESTSVVWTDKKEYYPDEIASIFGYGFNPFAEVEIQIVRPDLVEDVIFATADEFGYFSCEYQLDGVHGTYHVTATDGVNVATTTFDNWLYLKAEWDDCCCWYINVRASGLRKSKSYYVKYFDPAGEERRTSPTYTGVRSFSDSYTILPSLLNILGEWTVKLYENSVLKRTRPKCIDKMVWTTDSTYNNLVTSFNQGETIYFKAIGLKTDKYYRFMFKAPSGAKVYVGDWTNEVTNLTGSYTLPSDAETGSWKLHVREAYDSSGTCEYHYVDTCYFEVTTAPPPPQYYLTVRTAPPDITTISGEGWYDSCETVTLTTLELVPGPSEDIRYTFFYWDVDEVPRDEGVNPIEVHMDDNHIATAHYLVQYYLNVTADPDVTIPDGSAWYNESDYASIYAPEFISITPGESRYRFDGWTTEDMDEIAEPTVTSTTVFMDKPKTVTAHYVVQYKITFDQTGVGSDFTGVVLTVDGTDYGVADLYLWFWWDEDTVHDFAFASPLNVDEKRYVWVSTSGLSNKQSDTITVTTSGDIVGDYKIQYYLTLTTDPPGVTTPSGEGWYDEGTSAPISTAEFVDITPGSSHYKFNGWTTTYMSEIADPDSSSTTVLMDKAKTVTANYVVQYLVTFDQTGLDDTAVGTVVTVDSAPKTLDVLPFSTWVDEDTLISYTYESIVESTISGKRFILIDVTGPGSPIPVTESVTVVGNYKTQFYFTVTSPHGSPTPASGWFDAGTSIDASVTSPWSGPTGVRYVCTGWSGTGNVPVSGTTTSVTFTINEPSGITWNWETQCYLTVQIDPAGITTIPGEDWYSYSETVELTAPPVTGYDFLTWDVDGDLVSGNPIQVHMDEPHTATAHYRAVAVPVGGYSVSLTQPTETTPLIGYTMILAIFGAVLTLFRRKRK